MCFYDIGSSNYQLQKNVIGSGNCQQQQNGIGSGSYHLLLNLLC